MMDDICIDCVRNVFTYGIYQFIKEEWQVSTSTRS